jgi:vanillate O-demethylase ferredoxin subunit
MTTAMFRPAQAVYEIHCPAFEENRALDTVVHAISRASRSGVSRMYDLRAADPSVPLPAFESGAHIDVHVGPSLVRQYSLLNSPHEQGRYLICVRRDDTGRGGSTAVHRELTVGQRLRISAPRNHFPLLAADRHVLVAGGIGIAPLLSMAEELTAGGGDFTLHHYASSERDAPLLERVRGADFADRVVIHRSDDGDSVRAGLPADLRTPVPAALVYVCGPDGFMTYVTEQATAAGWLPRQLHLERFGVLPTRP